MLALRRALLMHPEVLMLDEPSLGLSPNYVDVIFDKLESINRDGTTIVLVEQNARVALEISDRAYVLASGKIGLEGRASELMDDSRVKEVLL